MIPPWVTRIPSTVSEVGRLINTDLVMTPGNDPKYAFYATDLNYDGIPQRSIVVWSDETRKTPMSIWTRPTRGKWKSKCNGIII